ncbi:MAG: transglycosylase SLT domain-containing protein [Spirochaetota bacterium]
MMTLHILVAAILILFTAVAPASSRKAVDGREAVRLFREERYQEVVDLFEGSQAGGGDHRVLLPLSLVELERPYQAVGELAALYERSPESRYFFAYLTARINEQAGEPAAALRWYRRVLRQLDGGRPLSYDQEMVLLAAFNKLSVLGREQQAAFRLLGRYGSSHPAARYSLGVLSQETRRLEEAALSFYTLLIQDTDERYTEAVLRRISADPEVIDRLVLIGMEESTLLELYHRNQLYREAVSLSYRMRPVEQVLDLRASSFFGLGEYGSAIRALDDLYRMSGGAPVMLRIAESYLMAGERGLAERYLERYHELLDDNPPAPRAALLRIHLDWYTADLDTLLERAARFTEEHGSSSRADLLIYQLFYRAVSQEERDKGLDLLARAHAAITDPVYRTWALYILGIYRDRSFLEKAIDLRAGTFHHVRAMEAVKARRKAVLEADATGENYSGSSDTFQGLVSPLKNGPFAGVVLWLSSLFGEDTGRGFPAHAGNPGTQSASREEKLLKTMDEVYDGWLYRCVELGAPGLAEEVVSSGYQLGGWELQTKGHVLLSHAAYARDDVVGGMTHAEIMGELLPRRYHLYLPKKTLSLLYPRVYAEHIERSISKHYYHLNTSLVLAVIREESRFNPRARSLRGATGLMQLMPQTAEWITGMRLSVRDLYDPAVNIEAGVRYLEYLFSRFHTLEEVLAAYNGGPTNVGRWKNQEQDLTVEQFIEEIPFPETRIYVKKVYTTYCIYQALYR